MHANKFMFKDWYHLSKRDLPKKSKEFRPRRQKLRKKSKEGTAIERKKKLNKQIIKNTRNRNLNIIGKSKSPLTSKPVTITKPSSTSKEKTDSVVNQKSEEVLRQKGIVDETDLDVSEVINKTVVEDAIDLNKNNSKVLKSTTEAAKEELKDLEVNKPTEPAKEEMEDLEVNKPTEPAKEELEDLEVNKPTEAAKEENINVTKPTTEPAKEEMEDIEVNKPTEQSKEEKINVIKSTEPAKEDMEDLEVTKSTELTSEEDMKKTKVTKPTEPTKEEKEKDIEGNESENTPKDEDSKVSVTVTETTEVSETEPSQTVTPYAPLVNWEESTFVITGGRNEFMINLNTVEKLELESSCVLTPKAMKRMPFAIYDHMSFFVRDKFVFCGGHKRPAVVSNQCFGLQNIPGANWTELPNIPELIFDSADTTIGNTAYIIGGFIKEPSDTVLSFNGITEEWKREPSLTRGRYASCAVSFDDTIYVIGQSQSQSQSQSL